MTQNKIIQWRIDYVITQNEMNLLVVMNYKRYPTVQMMMTKLYITTCDRFKI